VLNAHDGIGDGDGGKDIWWIGAWVDGGCEEGPGGGSA